MKLKFNQNSELFFPEFGLFKPNQIIEFKDESIIAKKMLRTGCFNLIEEEKKRKVKKIKKSKKKGVDK